MKRYENPRPSEEFYLTEAPTEGVDLGVWGDEVLKDTEAARHDSQLRLLLGARTLQLLDRLAQAPTRHKYFERVRAGIHIEPVEVFDADEGWYRDAVTGRWVVQEEDGSWFLEVPHPPGVFTLGEMVELEARLWGASEALAQAAEGGFLDTRQRQAALGVVEAADNLQMRLTIKKWHPDQQTRNEAKRDALEVLAGERGRPELTVVKKLKRKLLR